MKSSSDLILSSLPEPGCDAMMTLFIYVVGGGSVNYCIDTCTCTAEYSRNSACSLNSLSRMGLRRFPQPCGDFGRREGEAQLVLDIHADGGGDDVRVVGVDRRKEKLCTAVGLRVDLVESPLPLQRIEHHPRDLRFAR